MIAVTSTILIVIGNPDTYEVKLFGLSTEVTLRCIYCILCFLWVLNLNESINFLNLGKIGNLLTKLGTLVLSPLIFAFFKLYNSIGESYVLRNGLIEIRRIYTAEEMKSELLQSYGFGEYVQQYPISDKLAEVGNSRESFLCIFDKDYQEYLAKAKCSLPKVELSKLDLGKKYVTEAVSGITEFASDFYGSHPYIVWGIGGSVVLVGLSVVTYKMGFFGVGKDNSNIEEIKTASTMEELSEQVKNLRIDQANTWHYFQLTRKQVVENTHNILGVKLSYAMLLKDLTKVTDVFGSKNFTAEDISLAKSFVKSLTPETTQILLKLLNELIFIEKNSKWPNFEPSYTQRATMYDGVKKYWNASTENVD